MRRLDALEALAHLAAADTTDRVGALGEATRTVGAVIGSDDVRLFAGDGVSFEAYPPRANEDFFGLSPAGLMSANTELRRLDSAAVYTVGADGMPHEIAPADGRRAGTHVGLALWTGHAYSGTIAARGPWPAADARRAGRFIALACPALAMIFEHVADADRMERIQQQMNGLASVAEVFTRSKKLREVLEDMVSAINSATGFLSSIDVLDSRGRVLMRSTAASRFTGTPLYDAWLKLTRAPDRVRQIILEDQRPVLLPDLHNDPRLSTPVRQFYREASIVSGATFPLLFQGEVVGLLKVGSLKPLSFTPQVVDLLRSLAAQAAVVVKGVQLWEELQRSRKETERYAAQLQASMQIEHHLARIDHLCGIPNRRYLDEVVAGECARSARYASPLSLAMADLDDFKCVNDTFGHAVGDEVLRQFAAVARSSCRKSDLVGRLGGDEFLFVLAGTKLDDAVVWAERFRGTLEETSLLSRGAAEIRLTASLGVTEADGHSLASPQLLLRRCDESLYEAKTSGKNAVRCHRQPQAAAV